MNEPVVKESASTLLVLFLPSRDRNSQPIDQDLWEEESLRMLGRCFGGATAFPRGRGVWRDDARDGALVFDEPIVVQCYTSDELIEQHADDLKAHLLRMGHETKQGAVGYVIDGDYLEIQFSLEDG